MQFIHFSGCTAGNEAAWQLIEADGGEPICFSSKMWIYPLGAVVFPHTSRFSLLLMNERVAPHLPGFVPLHPDVGPSHSHTR